MRDLSELIAHVQSLAGDVLVATPAFVLSALNLAVATLAKDVRPPDMIVTSPSITVLPADMTKSMPTNFLGPRVFRAYNVTTGKVVRTVHYRLTDFFRATPQENTIIECLCIKGSQFFLQPGRIGTEQLQFTYTKKPQLYVEDDKLDATVLSAYPLVEIAEEAIAQHAAYQCFMKIEEGIDGAKKNAEAALMAYKNNASYFTALFGPQNNEQEPQQVMAVTAAQMAGGGIW